MALTQDEKDDVNSTVSIELQRMFQILASVYSRPGHLEEAKWMVEIEKSIRKDWELFKLPA